MEVVGRETAVAPAGTVVSLAEATVEVEWETEVAAAPWEVHAVAE